MADDMTDIDVIPVLLQNIYGIQTQPTPPTPVGGWFASQTVSGIPQESVGWLVAQGWVPTATAENTTTRPYTYTYTMQRQSLQNLEILQSLVNSWTVAHNDARANTEFRYNQVLYNWSRMLLSSQEQFVAQVEAQNAEVEIHFDNLETYMTAVEVLITANQTSMDDAVAAVVTLVTGAGGLTALMTAHALEYDALIDTLLTDYEDYEGDFSAALNVLPTDWNTHAGITRDFLTDLGSTDLARINEEFDASRAAQLQELTDKGMYSSGRWLDIKARSDRDRSERISQLNDQLAREKLTNQHQLFAQQESMRGRVLDGTDRLYDRKTAMRQGTMAGLNQLHGLKQELLRYRIAQELQNADAIVSHKHKAIVELMNTAVARLEGQWKLHDSNQRLMAYQLDERNKLLIGLYGFIERRTDVGPSINDLAQLAVGLADSGGGWITP